MVRPTSPWPVAFDQAAGDELLAGSAQCVGGDTEPISDVCSRRGVGAAGGDRGEHAAVLGSRGGPAGAEQLLHLPGHHDSESVAEAMIAEMSQLPEHLRRSLTWDRGTALARYARTQLDLAMPVYFCDPHSPWQHGTNEDTDRLLRHWLTKGTDLSRFTAADLRRIAASLNARSRPTLDMQTPVQALDALLSNQAAA